VARGAPRAASRPSFELLRLIPVLRSRNQRRVP
jgi:hypothetical protein